MPSTTTAVQFTSGSLRLEGELHQPAEGDASTVVVVCHPHPQRGGDMRNNVVSIVVAGLNAVGIAALVFNFRGVGRSEGAYDNGVGEREDARAALAYARSLEGVTAVALAGYSFGAGVAASVVDAAIPALCLVALPSRAVAEDAGVRSYGGPLLFISGDQDSVSSLEAIRELSPTLPGQVSVVGVSGADHFWWGHERQLAEAVGEFFGGRLARSG